MSSGAGRGGSRTGGGRIFPHERGVDNAPIIGGSLGVGQEHKSSMLDTEKNTITDTTRIEHRNRIKYVYNFNFAEYEEYAEGGVKELSEEELLDKTKF